MFRLLCHNARMRVYKCQARLGYVGCGQQGRSFLKTLRGSSCFYSSAHYSAAESAFQLQKNCGVAFEFDRGGLKQSNPVQPLFSVGQSDREPWNIFIIKDLCPSLAVLADSLVQPCVRLSITQVGRWGVSRSERGKAFARSKS